MGRFWKIAGLLIGCFLLNDACEICVPREHCLLENTVAVHYPDTECPGYQVCCKVPPDNTNETPTRINNAINCEPEISGTANVPISYWPIENPTDPTDPSVPFFVQNPGISNPLGLDPSQKVDYGFSKPFEYPWVVAVFVGYNNRQGGSLISPEVVLTSFSPLQGMPANTIVVRAGEWDISSTREAHGFEEREVEKIVHHEEFDFLTGANNIALLFLKTPYVLKPHIRIIGFPDRQRTYDGLRCTVASWGKTRYTDSHYSTILKKVDLPMMSRDMCRIRLRSTILGRNFELPQSLICAGGEANIDVCTGDGGSALFCPIGDDDSGAYEQVGIVNWGLECGLEGVPGTYTDVSMFKDWIEEKMLIFQYR